MKTFSQRKGIKPVSEIIQIDSMDSALRNSIWNMFDREVWSSSHFMDAYPYTAPMESFCKRLWIEYFKRPVDTMPDHTKKLLVVIRAYYFECTWSEVYDFIEVSLSFLKNHQPRLTAQLNAVLERELSGYRIVRGRVVDITGAEEVAMLDEALKDTKYDLVSRHLQRALELYSDRKSPDYRNSIKESISAVESLARTISEKPSASLKDALAVLEGGGNLHPALKGAFIKLYGYTSDADGIRHAMLEEPTLTAADARYFLMSCTAFVNYLKSCMK